MSKINDKKKIETQIFIISLIIFVFFQFLFLTLVTIDWTWSVGWVYGSFSMYFSYYSTILVIRFVFKKTKSKKIAFVLVFLKSILTLVLLFLWVLLMIFIDTKYNNLNFLYSGVESIKTPINIITFLSSISLIALSTIIAVIIERKKKKGKNG